MVQTYTPGETVPKDGTVQCIEHPGIRNAVRAGTRFPPCHHFSDGKSEDRCVWRYV